MCTLEKQGNVFILTLTGPDDHRLNPARLNSILSSLRDAKSQSVDGSVLITTSKGSSFFSNGFDLAWAAAANNSNSTKQRFHQMSGLLREIVEELISFPMPTIAALQGHAAAAGLILALSHDYVLMRGDKGVLYMSEVDLGILVPELVAALFREKIGSGRAFRELLLGGKKVRGEEAVRRGMVDGVFDGEVGLENGALGLAEKLGKRKWDGAVYREIRKGLYSEWCGKLGLGSGVLPSKL